MWKWFFIGSVFSWFFWFQASIAEDMAMISILNDSEAVRKVQVVDNVCGSKLVLKRKLGPGQIAQVQVYSDNDGFSSIVITQVAGCASAVTRHFEGLAPGAKVNLQN